MIKGRKNKRGGRRTFKKREQNEGEMGIAVIFLKILELQKIVCKIVYNVEENTRRKGWNYQRLRCLKVPSYCKRPHTSMRVCAFWITANSWFIFICLFRPVVNTT